ncbi:MAG: hypothetical protein JXQ87_13730 [Bacteroidia bacterium]
MPKVVLLILIYLFSCFLTFAQSKEEIDSDELIVQGYSYEQLNSIGMSAYYNGNYPLALACFKELLKTYVQNQDEENIRKTRIFLAEILRGARSYETALLILKKVKARIANETPGLMHAYLYNRRAAINFEIGEIDKSLSDARRALSIEKSIGSTKYNSNSVNIIGACFRSKGQLDSAYFYLNRAYQMAWKDSTQIDNVIINGFNKSNYFKTLDKLDSALFYSKYMVRLCLRHDQTTQLYHIYDQISSIYEDKNDFESALKYQKLKSHIRTERANKRSEENFDKMVQALEINYSEQEKRKADEKMKRERIYIVSLVILLLLSISFTIPLVKTIKKKRDLNNSLIEKTKSLDNRNEELKESNKINRKLFSVLAHDLRAPVSSLSGLLDLLEKGYLDDEERQEVTKKLGTQLLNTEQLLGSIVTWSKSQLNKGVLNIEKVSLSSIIEKEVTLLAQNASNKSINVSIVNNCLDQIQTDKDMMGVIIRNLLNNAIKFTLKNGSVEVGCKPKENGWFKVWVKDNGIGMTQSRVDQLFSSDTNSGIGTNKEQGFGLGLMLCYDFSKMLGANIEVESEEGLGSTFTVCFPAL